MLYFYLFFYDNVKKKKNNFNYLRKFNEKDTNNK